MIRRLDTAADDVFALLRRRTLHRDAETEAVVASIIADVRARGDDALLEAARRFDAPGLDAVLASEAELSDAELAPAPADALRTAIARVRRFHDAQRALLDAGPSAWSVPALGVGGGTVGQRMLPVDAAGVYVPGGRAAYPSSVVMNAVPALSAGVGRVACATPARRDGTLPEAVRFALRELGVRQVLKVGGAAAVAALALGTETVDRVDVVVGPGNRFVNEAKRQLWGEVGLDGYAGPSEVAVLVDETSHPAYAAADLITQIEHAPDNAGFLVAVGHAALEAVLAEVARQVESAPRAETIQAALRDHSLAIACRDEAEAVAVVDAIAPEHLSVATRDPEATAARVRHAGCILLGEWSPESAGDFAAGPSHTLPTSGAARFGSPVNVLHFLRVQSLIRLDRSGFEALAPTIEAFAELEGFPAHGYGAVVRRST